MIQCLLVPKHRQPATGNLHPATCNLPPPTKVPTVQVSDTTMLNSSTTAGPPKKSFAHFYVVQYKKICEDQFNQRHLCAISSRHQFDF